MNKRKIEVVQHALVLFQEKGIIQTSIQDIIERSGISKGTFYNYFNSKNECVNAVIEHVRYEASLIRSEIQLGKPTDDVSVLVEQIVEIAAMNQVYGLPSIFEQMLVSLDKELKQYVMLYRIHEVAWFSNRIVDIYGEEVRPYSFEVATLFYGMLNHVKFLQRVLHDAYVEDEVKKTVNSLISYVEPIIQNIMTKPVAILNQQHLERLLTPIKESLVHKADLLEDIMQLKKQNRLTKYQLELTDSIYEELVRDELRIAVLGTLLPAYVNVFRNTDMQLEAKQIHNSIWVYMNQT